MRRCTDCLKPLTDFEISFHNKAKSPSHISCKCWKCSGAKEEFDKAVMDKPNHSIEILTCIVSILIILAFVAPVIPYWNQLFPIIDAKNIPSSVKIQLVLAIIVYFVVGSISSVIINLCGKKYPSSDPPEEDTTYTYGESRTEYVSKERYDGAIVTEKVTIPGGDMKTNWSLMHPPKKKSFSSIVVDIIFAPVSFLFEYGRTIAFGFLFAIWAIPYIAVMFIQDQISKNHRRKIPYTLRNAYKTSKANTKYSDLSYRDKVGFLSSKHWCLYPKTPESRFSEKFFETKDNYDKHYPFFYRKIKNTAYMIIDYKKQPSATYGIAFVLVKFPHSDIEKKMVIGNEFVFEGSCDWAIDWKTFGAKQTTITNIEWYEQKFNSILNSKSKQNAIMGE